MDMTGVTKEKSGDNSRRLANLARICGNLGILPKIEKIGDLGGPPPT